MKNKTITTVTILTVVFNTLFFVCLGLYIAKGNQQPYVALFYTSLMFAYHTDIRLLIAFVLVGTVKNRINIDAKKYDVSDAEFARLSRLSVKKWKDKFIAWDKNQFVVHSLKDRTNFDRVMRNNICAEIIHWACFVAGMFAILIGCLLSPTDWWIFVITAVVVTVYADIPPIIIQRFNRHRLQKLKTRLG